MVFLEVDPFFSSRSSINYSHHYHHPGAIENDEINNRHDAVGLQFIASVFLVVAARLYWRR